ncbi:9473_t:CDS:2 [Cetraspora pellucida]|uniref:9473_t:CDS:1 n=1 Tax=Cetraspora pellucida TaxID=1433469 RepID=A0ACA9L1R0_9GLOM|nr:9473_t:CDS:2 [Cetraspora pellucida]
MSAIIISRESLIDDAVKDEDALEFRVSKAPRFASVLKNISSINNLTTHYTKLTEINGLHLELLVTKELASWHNVSRDYENRNLFDLARSQPKLNKHTDDRTSDLWPNV